MVKIRLSLKGKKKRPYYHIVAADVRSPRDGKILDTLGFYDPSAEKNEDKAKLCKDKYKEWLAKGAQPTKIIVQIARFSSPL